MALVGTLISTLISVFIICLLVYFAIYPEPIKFVLSALYINPEYEANENATKTAKTTLYSNPGSKHDKLIVVFIGGGGLFSKMTNIYGFTNKLNELMGSDYDILTFEYPIRFKNTILDSMLAINKILLDYIHYTTIHAVGISFGSLLAGAFYNKEMTLTKSSGMSVPQIGMRFTSLCVLSGVLECNFNVDIITKLFKFYIMRNTPGIINYTCYGLPIPKFIVSANSDFLVAQTSKFIQNETCEYKIYDSKTLPHAFCQLTNLDEAVDSIKRVRDFIIKVDNPVLMPR